MADQTPPTEPRRERGAPEPAAHDSEVVVHTELVGPEPAAALAGVLDTNPPDGALFPLWHWVYLLERRPQHELGPDGHPTSGIPAPPGQGCRRMFAGGRVTTDQPLRQGHEATRTSQIIRTTHKDGRSGPLSFVTVRHSYEQDGHLCVVDEQDIVYRQPGAPLEARPGSLADPAWPGRAQPCLALTADEALLFRFSALTYNAHRIHYDHQWAAREGYPGLVVHGPLQALLMAEFLRRQGVGLAGRTFAYRLVAPMTGPQTLVAQAGPRGLPSDVEIRSVHGVVTAAGEVR